MTVDMTDRIEKTKFLKAPRSRVWRALTTPAELGQWFGVALDTVPSFESGQRVSVPVTMPEYKHLMFNIIVDEIVPEQRFSFRWHPNEMDPQKDYSSEPMTRVVFELEDADGGTTLKVVESGFDDIPLARRAEAYRGNDGGWTQQVENLARHVSHAH